MYGSELSFRRMFEGNCLGGERGMSGKIYGDFSRVGVRQNIRGKC